MPETVKRPLQPFRHTLFLSLLLTLVGAGSLSAQVTGGRSIYDFIDLPASPRVAGAGGSLIATRDNDISLAYHNPSLLNKKMDGQVFFSDAIYMAGINHGYVGYVRDYDKIATFQAGVQYVSYGKFQGADETGLATSKFSAGEFAINLGASRQYQRYSYGANLKLIYSGLGGYTSIGTALDLAAAYDDTAHQLTASLLIKNIGGELKPYYKGAGREITPIDVQLGFSKRFKHVPFRIGIVLHHLTQYDVRYNDPSLETTSNVLISDSTASDNKGSSAKTVIDNLARHVIINGEVYITKVFRLSFGYNHMRRAELAPGVKPGLAGFSFGVGINIKQFSFGFARARYSGTQATTQISVAVNLNGFTKKKVKTDTTTPTTI